MAWEVVNTFTDDATGVVVEKQHNRRPNRGNQTRYLVRHSGDKYFAVNRTQIFDLTDAFNDLCDLLEKGEF